MASAQDKGEIRVILVLIVISLTARLLVFLGSGAVLWPDSLTHYQTAALIADYFSIGRGNYYGTPLYPFFLSLFLCFGRSPLIGELIIVAQHLMGFASVVFVYLFARKLISTKPAFVVALLFSLHSLLLYYETVILTEIVFVFFLTLLLYYFSSTSEKPTLKKSFISGILCALTTLSRPIAQFLPIFLCGYLIYRAVGRRAKALCAVSLIAGYLLLLGPWLLINHSAFGVYAVSLGKGVNLFLRVYEIEGIPPKVDTRYPKIKSIFESVRANVHKNHVYFEVRNEVIKLMHGSASRADEAMFKFALEGLKAEPVHFAIGTVKQLFKFFFHARNSIHFCTYDKGSFLCTPKSRFLSCPPFPQDPSSRVPFFQNLLFWYFVYFKIPIWLVSTLAIIGLFYFLSDSNTRAFSLMLLLIIAYFSIVSCTFNMPEDRYRLPLDPILFIFAINALIGTRHYFTGRLEHK